MKLGMESILDSNNKKIHSISAGNYGGNLGPYHFKLREILDV